MTAPVGIVDDPMYGRVAPALGWVPAPRYLLRRDVVLRLLRNVPQGRALEIGCGAGALLADLRARGFDCEAVETSDAARELATTMLADLPTPVHAETSPEWRERFDLVLALEVLEHIEDDTAALREWAGFVRPGGRLLLSVPAHARKWSPTDVWAGHYRRYDRRDFLALAERCGLRVRRCVNYGYPLGNLSHGVKAALVGRDASLDESGDTRAARTAGSGVRRSAEARVYPLLASRPGRILMRVAMQAQSWFAGTELGNGFVLEATRP